MSDKNFGKSGNHDTIGMVALDKNGKIAAGTSTNGASFKIPGYYTFLCIRKLSWFQLYLFNLNQLRSLYYLTNFSKKESRRFTNTRIRSLCRFECWWCSCHWGWWYYDEVFTGIPCSRTGMLWIHTTIINVMICIVLKKLTKTVFHVGTIILLDAQWLSSGACGKDSNWTHNQQISEIQWCCCCFK